MKKQPFLTVFLLVILIIFGINDNYAQIAETLHVPDSGYVQILRNNDGSTLYGRITAIYDKEIEFATEISRKTMTNCGIVQENLPTLQIIEMQYH